MSNKVNYNLKNIHVAKHTTVDPSTGVITFDTPFAIPGAVSLSLEAKGETSVFYADGIEYYTSTPNLGYEGDVEAALATEEFRTKILNEVLDQKNVLMENADVEPSKFAFGFEIDGDEKGTMFWFYNCSVSRPTVASKTTEENKEVQTDTLKIKIAPGTITGIDKRIVRTKTTEATDAETRTNWFTAVYVPTPVVAAASKAK